MNDGEYSPEPGVEAAIQEAMRYILERYGPGHRVSRQVLAQAMAEGWPAPARDASRDARRQPAVRLVVRSLRMDELLGEMT
jgi:hypothetical protein